MHTYPNSWGRLKGSAEITRLTPPFVSDLVSDLEIYKLKKYDVEYDLNTLTEIKRH